MYFRPYKFVNVYVHPTLHVIFYSTKNMGMLNFGNLDFGKVRFMEYLDFGKVGFGKSGILGKWDFGIVRFWERYYSGEVVYFGILNLGKL